MCSIISAHSNKNLSVYSLGSITRKEKKVNPTPPKLPKAPIKLLNDLLSHERFGILLQSIKRYRDIASGNDTMAILQDFMVELESPVTGKTYGSKEENTEMMKEFCLHIASKYFDEIVKDIVAKAGAWFCVC